MTLSARLWFCLLAGIALGAAILFSPHASAEGNSPRPVVRPADQVEPADHGGLQTSVGVTSAALLPTSDPGHISWLVVGIGAIVVGVTLAAMPAPRRRPRRGRFDNRGFCA